MINRIPALVALVLVFSGGGAHGQISVWNSDQVFECSDGTTIWFGRWNRVVLRRPQYVELIEGIEGELEPIEDDESALVEDEAVEYRVIEIARGLLAGEMDDVVIPAEQDDGRGKLTTRQRVVEGAIAAYGTHLQEHPEDSIALREMGVALLEANRIKDGVQLIHEAYLRNPELGILPIRKVVLGENPERLRKLVVKLVKYSHRESSAQGWLAVGVLMQCEGRDELAVEMLDRAVELGLDGGGVQGLRGALP